MDTEEAAGRFSADGASRVRSILGCLPPVYRPSPCIRRWSSPYVLPCSGDREARRVGRPLFASEDTGVGSGRDPKEQRIGDTISDTIGSTRHGGNGIGKEEEPVGASA